MKKLELENFRQYKGKQTIVFSTNPEKNVTLILGKNTSGKTTIIHAFRWVLYNNCNFTGKKDDRKAVLNSDIRNAMRPGDVSNVCVILTFKHNNMIYEISRCYEYKYDLFGYHIDENVTLCYYPNGERVIMKGGDANLESILPESLAEYFFFDGEKIAQSRKTDNVKDSINNIMGLVPLQNMIDHLSKGRYNVFKDFRDSLKPDSNSESIRSDIDKIEEKIRITESIIKNIQEEYKTQDHKAEKLRGEMEEIKDVANSASELKKVDAKIDENRNKISSKELEIIQSFADAMYESMINYVSTDILKSIRENKYEDKGIPGMNATAIYYLLEHKKCICGTDLATSKSCVEKLKELLIYLPPESIGSQISTLCRNLENSEMASDKQKAFDQCNEYYLDLLGLSEDLENDHRTLADKVKNHKDADLIMQEYDHARNLKEQLHNEEMEKQKILGKLSSDLASYQKNLDTAARADKFNQEILTKMEYVQALYDKANEVLDDNSKSIFEDIQKTLTDVFNKMYHGHRTIEITNDYKVRLTVSGEQLDNSKGLDTVQNFAFIASLLKVARDRSSLDVNSEPYPLAMDAVFSNTDGVHICNICQTLPQLAEQAILALMDKDWEIASPSLENHVGKKYCINKISETYSEIKEVLE